MAFLAVKFDLIAYNFIVYQVLLSNDRGKSKQSV